MKRFALVIILFIFLTACAPPPTFEAPLVELEKPEKMTDPFEGAPLKTFAIRAYRFEFDPNEIIVDEGDHVRITVTSLDVGHGFALPDFGINEKVPPEDSTTIDFLADRPGEFGFFSSVYSGKGYKNMTGTFTVRARAVSPMADMNTDPRS